MNLHCVTRGELSDLLQRTYPLLFDICPLTMRTQGILLVRDAVLFLNSYPADSKGDLNILPWAVTDLLRCL